MGTYTWTITPNDIDREIKVWEDRKSGKLKNGWDFLAINYDADQIINVLNYAKELNKSVLITNQNLFWKADIIYYEYAYNNTNKRMYRKEYKECDIIENKGENNKLSDIKEKPMAVNFRTVDQRINFPMICYYSQNFSELEQNLYIEFPDLNQENTVFVYNGNTIDKSISIKDNKIIDGANIIIIEN